jgi:hypothetical protein
MQEGQRIELENQRETIIHQFNLEKDEMLRRFEHEREELENEIGALQRERDDQLIMAENDKQQVKR